MDWRVLGCGWILTWDVAIAKHNRHIKEKKRGKTTKSDNTDQSTGSLQRKSEYIDKLLIANRIRLLLEKPQLKIEGLELNAEAAINWQYH